MTRLQQEQGDPFEMQFSDDSGVSLREVGLAIHRGRRTIRTVILAAALLYSIAAVSVILLAPARKLTTLPFRLEFRGADRGQYPNGTKFSASEIVGTPVLLRVFRADALEDTISFDDFKNSVYVTESNATLEELTREYEGRLGDPKLSSVDRERIEKEFRDKKESLSHNEYSISLLTTEGTRRIPSSVRTKVLSDILQTWAEQTIQNKGVALYDLSILSSGIFERDSLDSYDYVIALDMLRSKINRILANIDQLLDIPGAKVIRTPRTNASLAELRVRLEDTLNFKILPLIGTVMNEHLSKTPNASIQFLESQLTFNDLAKKEAESRAKTLRDTLATYVEEQRNRAQQGAPGQPRLSSETVIPQIGDTFFDRLVELTGKDTDTKYRQDLVDEMKGQSLRVVPLEAEAAYYRTLLDSLQKLQNNARPATPAEHAAIKAQMDAAINEAIGLTNQVNEIYYIVSKNLTPSTMLYSVQAPITSVERSISGARLALFGLLILLVALFGSIVYVVLHERMFGQVESITEQTEVPVQTDEELARAERASSV